MALRQATSDDRTLRDGVTVDLARHFLVPLVGIVAVTAVALVALLLWLTAQQDAAQLSKEKAFADMAIRTRMEFMRNNLDVLVKKQREAATAATPAAGPAAAAITAVAAPTTPAIGLAIAAPATVATLPTVSTAAATATDATHSAATIGFNSAPILVDF